MRAAHGRLVLSISPLPLLFPTIKKVALASYWSRRSSTIGELVGFSTDVSEAEESTGRRERALPLRGRG